VILAGIWGLVLDFVRVPTLLRKFWAKRLQWAITLLVFLGVPVWGALWPNSTNYMLWIELALLWLGMVVGLVALFRLYWFIALTTVRVLLRVGCFVYYLFVDPDAAPQAVSPLPLAPAPAHRRY